MYISLNWIKDFVNLDGIDINYLVNQITMSCAEVEGVTYKGKNITGVISAQIKDVQEVPNSKKLHLLKVDTGKEVLQIVCGAPNVRIGLKVALATIGAKLGDITIGKAKLAGYESYGMCCGGDEIGISDDHAGLVELDDDTPIGKDIKEVLDIEDTIVEIDNKSLTNRPDLWGHYGIAREISALTGRPLKSLEVEPQKSFAGKEKSNITVTSKNCYRYTSATMQNITKKTSNLNMQIRLFYCGMRAINLLADITNYIMLELGQPMHAFDNKIVKSVQVFNLDNDAEFVTLDSSKRTLKKGTMVIATNNTPVAVAGVMGGLDSEITDDTSSVLIESACFDGLPIRKTALSLGMRTESSARYEKMLDPELTMTALLRYAYLVKENDKKAEITSDICDVYNYHYPKINITLTKKYIDNYIGIDISENKILEILKSLQFNVKITSPNTYSIDVPSFRATKDVSCKADIIEEITRVYGYDNIDEKTLSQPLLPSVLAKEIKLEYDIKYTLANRYNLSEIHSYLWYDLEANNFLKIEPTSVVRCVNSINKDNDKLRNTIIPSLLKTVLDNKNAENEISIFEIGRVVKSLNKDGIVNETKSLGIVLYDKNENSNTLLLKLKNIIDYLFTYIIKSNYSFKLSTPNEKYYHPINYYQIICNNRMVGNINILHPNTKNNIDKNCGLAVCEINFSEIVDLEEIANKFEKISKFPTTKLDFNFLVPNDKLYSDIQKIANSVPTELNYKVNLLDIYQNENSNLVSYTLHYELNSFEHNLTSQDIEVFHSAVIEQFRKNNFELKL